MDGGPEPTVPAPPASIYLFVSGEPFASSAAGGPRPQVSAALGGPYGYTSWGGHEAADFEGGQVYGPDARVGRLVLSMARRRGLGVKVVDVNDPGGDAGLVQRFVGEDDVFPLLVRADGARISGSEAFTPEGLARFLDAVQGGPGSAAVLGG